MSSLLLNIYGQAQRAGLLKNARFQQMFQKSYFIYKRLLEDPFHSFCTAHKGLLANGNVLDIGANIGYTASVFSEFVGDEFKVFAFEPEPSNFSLLTQMIAEKGYGSRICAINSAVGDAEGTIELWLNELHHADHRVMTHKLKQSKPGAEMISVPMQTIDAFVARNKHFPISFIKIDVQGFELPVCMGMEQTLKENPNSVVAFEYCAEAMIDLGYEPSELLRFFQNREFHLYALNRGAHLIPLHNDEDALLTNREYVDIIATKHSLNRGT